MSVANMLEGIQNGLGVLGRVTVQLEDQHGNVKQKEVHHNVVTDTYLLSLMLRNFSEGPVGAVTRGVNKVGTSGQYTATASNGNFGIYLMNGIVPITKKTKMPPYVVQYNQPATGVVFYNIAGNVTETVSTMVPDDKRSGFSFVEEDGATLSFEYVKRTGTGAIRSILIGRAHDSPGAYQGAILGPMSLPENFTTGRTGSAVQHNADRTILWKTQGTGTTGARIIDLVAGSVATNVLPTGASQSVANIGNDAVLTTNALGAAGHIIAGSNAANSSNVRMFGVWLSAGSTSSTTIIFRRFSAADPESVNVALPKDPTGPSYNAAFKPIIVRRPDTGIVEIFQASGAESRVVGGITRWGSRVRKIVCAASAGTGTIHATTMPTSANLLGTSNANVVDVGWFDGYIPSAPCQYSSGFAFYDHIKRQYYFPCSAYVDPHGGGVTAATNVANQGTGYCPGYVYDAIVMGADTNNVPIPDTEWISRAGGNTYAPVRTNRGIAYIIANQTTPWYGLLTEMVSGIVLQSSFEKVNETDVLRVSYSYTLRNS